MLGDLQRLIHRATPRIEDHRAPDRMDFVRKEHGHLTLREIVDALDALEFSAMPFTEVMREHLATESTAAEGDAKPPEFTAVHGLFRAMEGLRFLSPRFAEPAASGVDAATGEEEATEGDGELEGTVAAAARARGADRFQKSDFAGAVQEYTSAIRATAKGGADLHAFYSNRSAARLKLPDGAIDALRDARRCVQLAPEWPKGRFREGSCLRQLGCVAEASAAFRAGYRLEPESKVWPKEIESTEQLRRSTPPTQARQLLFNLLPELLSAWVRGDEGGTPGGVLQVQARGDLKDLGAAKWQLLRDTKSVAKAQLRYAYLDRKDYLLNLAANLQSPPADVAIVDVDGQALKIAEFSASLPQEGSKVAAIHVDVQGGPGGKMLAVLCLVPCDETVRKFLASRKDPPPPKAAIDGVLHAQKTSGFPKAMPRLLGFHSFPGDLNFPVIDVKRDAPNLC